MTYDRPELFFSDVCKWANGAFNSGPLKFGHLLNLFALFLITSDFRNPIIVWTKFRDSLCYSLRRFYTEEKPISINRYIFDLGLFRLHQEIEDHGMTFVDTGLPTAWQQHFQPEVPTYELEAFPDESKLRRKQREIFNQFVSNYSENVPISWIIRGMPFLFCPLLQQCYQKLIFCRS